MTTLAVSRPLAFALGLSENPFAPLPSVIAALDRSSRCANRYPEFLPNTLAQIIAEHEQVDPGQVVVGAGATGVALQLLRALTEPGSTIVFSTPTFDGYPILARMCGLGLEAIPLQDDGQQDLDRMLKAVDDRTSAVIVCRPHNPTGTVLPTNTLLEFVEQIPKRVPVILDEAYIEFVSADLRMATETLLADHPNVVVLRTFSKAYGLAGLRIGYAVASEEIAQQIRLLQLPFGMVAAAEPAVSASYAAASELQNRVESIVAEREGLRAALWERGILSPVSHANFLYLPGANIGDLLSAHGIASRRYPNGAARITVGDPVAGRAVLDAVDAGRTLQAAQGRSALTR